MRRKRSSEPETGRPEISVVIVAGNHRRRARRAIDSILDQESDGRFELIVMDMAEPSRAEPLEIGDARAKRLSVPTWATFGAARAAAVEAAVGPVVAFLEEHCVAMPGWIHALVQAHRGPWAGVGAEVHNGNPGVGWSDAIYLMGYSTWIPPAKRGEAPLTATHNTSYKTDLLRDFGDRLPELLTAEPILQQELRKRGLRLFVEPEARFQHENETSLGSSSVLYWWNRSLGRIRAVNDHWSRLKKLAYVLLLPLVPWRRLARLSLYFFRFRRRGLWSLIRQAPRIWLLDLIATTGLAIGMIWGTTSDDMRFSDLELRSVREER